MKNKKPKYPPFVAVPKHILNSEEYAKLSAKAVKLLLDIFGQFNGKNNGDFCATMKFMKQKGWKSRDTFGKALKELLEKGFIEKTRQGGRNCCCLYAVTWLSVDDCNGKLDAGAIKRIPSNAWRVNT